jgi:CheY-like chemotaxis protein
MRQDEFAEQIADAYEHLYDLLYLRSHPLLDVLVPAPAQPDKKRARELHRTLLDAVDELDPGPQAPAFSHEWRRHRLLVLRYLKGLNPQAVADQLAVSLRHYYRVHKIAIEDVAELLWKRLAARQEAPEASPPRQDVSLSRLELLRLEAARMAQADRYAQIGAVLQGVLPLLQEMLHHHRIDVRLALSEALPAVSIDRSMLRQMLLGTTSYLVERTEGAALCVSAEERETRVSLTLALDPPAAVQPGEPEEVESRLASLDEMAALSGAHILPTYAGPAVVGFDLLLPTGERTVLVIDDNEDVLALMRSYLGPHRYRVIAARTAQEGLDKAVQFQPYAITLDLMMPERDGWDILQSLLNQPATAHIPVIICTVLKQKELALSLGAAGFLEKPVTEQSLLAALEALEEG